MIRIAPLRIIAPLALYPRVSLKKMFHCDLIIYGVA